ncbi:Common plant regulatory factor 1 [Sesamum angolense]|uniref:Common plant regulatory factor 1 n=1 Tax=Sesamum angolense TaxID=2727404 RepID=A0AAE1XGH6_9LAMI|nr:Common plant regulatory factor 1 [Sesamum angolense]
MTYCVVHAFQLAEHLPPQLPVTQWKIKGVPRRIMGNSEEAKPSKSEKSSPPAMDQNNVHVYPDWATMQAFYGPRLAVPPYMNSAVASPHAPPPYMWAPPQSMIPPYGAPYAAFYAHGGVYAHPGVPLAGTSLSMETPVKSSGNTDGGFVKKLKEIDGLAISIGNGNGSSAEHGTERRTSDSYDSEDSSDGSNGDTAGAGQSGKKRSRQGSPSRGDGKVEKKNSIVPVLEVVRASANAPVKAMENMSTALELKDPSLTVKSCPTNVPQASMPNETWLQNERELKRERRKQSNRESARRSRLRKQAETEELANKVQALTAENMTLKSEINKLMESSEKLKLDNAALMEKLKDAQLGQTDEISLHKIDDLRLKKPVGTVNLLARVNNSDSTDRKNEEGESYENRSPGAKLHQLLDSSPRTDAVAAG